ncbi:MAG TPA: YafY family protein [Flavobacterium sp.]|nr:YafY family protein [Flavobacterium sp.]
MKKLQCMLDETPKRFDRIVSILIQLQSKRIVKAHELAERFGVSLRTIYRDIRTLEASGVPIYSEAGFGYSLMEGYRLPPVMFTREEAGSFIAAEKLMQKYADRELGNYYSSAAYKLKAVLQSADKDWVTAVESNVLMQPLGIAQNEKVPNTLAALFKSIAEKTQIILSYQAAASEKTTERIIEPVGIFHDNNCWYALAYCHLRNDYRQFRTDRIQNIKTTDRPFELEHQPLEAYLAPDKDKHKTKVRILVAERAAPHLDYDKKYYGFVSQKTMGNQIEMTFMTENAGEYFARWYLMFGDHAVILEPEALKAKVADLIKKIQSRLK